MLLPDDPFSLSAFLRPVRLAGFVSLLALIPGSASAAVDTNGNGLCDVWETRYLAHGAAPGSDDDGDGASNADEAAAGTDPFDPGSRFAVRSASVAGAAARIEVPAEIGKRYRLRAADSPSGPWSDVGGAVLAESGAVVFEPTAGSGGGRFWKVEVSDADSDDDGVPDWAERQMAGFDPLAPDSFGPGHAGDDAAAAAELASALLGGQVSAVAETPAAFEKEGSPAVVRVARSGGADLPLTVYFKTAGAAAAEKSSAAATDYQIRDGAGAAPGGRLVIAAGEASGEIRVVPVPDAVNEVPEVLAFRFGFAPGGVETTVRDAANVSGNTRLFVAYLSPRPGVGGFGSGIATARLQGDNDQAEITVSFSNLEGAVNSTQLQVAGGGILLSVPPHKYGGQPWPIRAAQYYPTDQAVLDALFSGELLLNIFTGAYLNGEVAGNFSFTPGSTELQIPSDPPPVPALAGAELDREIVRFLSQATFGPTSASLDDMRARVAARGGDRIAAFGEWIDEQFALGSPSLRAYVEAADAQERALSTDPDYDPNYHNRRRGWWLLARHAPGQLRERVAFALSEIFVASAGDTVLRDRAYGLAAYYDTLKAGASGSYRSLIEAVSKHPVMGRYLSHLRNAAAVVDPETGEVLVSPDENYAREIMQLFSIGLVELHLDGSLKLGPDGLPVPTYDQTDITELSRVFTGWSFSKRNNPTKSATVVDNTNFGYGNGSQFYESQWIHPMKMFEDNGLAPTSPSYIRYHDNGAKSFLGLEIPAGQSGEQDLADALDHLASHGNVAPFMARRLIQRLVSSNPSAGYIYRVATVFRDSGGSFGETVKAILLDYEARDPGPALATVSAGKVQEPLLRYLWLARAFGGKSNLPLADLAAHGYPQAELDLFPAGTTRMRVPDTDSALGQTPQKQPTVFNWFLPDYVPGGAVAANGLVAPEMQLANESSVIAAINYLYTLVFGGTGQNGTALPGQAVASDDNLILDFDPLRAIYLGVLDENSDGAFDAADAGTFNNPAKIAEAVEAVVDRIDLLLCAGSMKARYGADPGRPRQIILDAVNAIRSADNGNASQQANAMNDRIQNALYLVATSPDCLVSR